MKIKNYFVVFLAQIFFSFFCYGADKVEIYFFDVGQGNCTLIKRPGASPILVDAGSSADTKRIQSQPQKDNIIKHINECPLKKCSSTKCHLKECSLRKCPNCNSDYDLDVIVSHPDKDHINWIESIAEKGNYNNRKGLKIRFLLGGAKEDYHSKVAQSLLCYITKNKYTFSFISSFDAGVDFNAPYLINGNSNFKLSILNLKDSSSDSNADSIVLKVQFGTISAILTGDATGGTTSHIIAMAKWKDYLLRTRPSIGDLGNFSNILGMNDLKANILQASHHGSDTEGSNNELWFQTVQPEFIICSSGEHANFFHPRYEVLERSYKQSYEGPKRLRPVDSHLFHCGHDLGLDFNLTPVRDRIEIFDGQYQYAFKASKEKNKKGSAYSILKTTYGIYNTRSSGSIVFEWKLTDTVLSPPKFQ